MVADKQFPVSEGSVISLSCKEGYQLKGDNLVTCQHDTQFQFLREPECGSKFNLSETFSSNLIL